jgi:hypothetical protein
MRDKLGIPKYKSGLSDTLLKGATFGLNDEIGAGLSAPLQYGIDKLTGKVPADATLGDYYRANLSNIREGEAGYEKENPVSSFAGEAAGGLMDFNPAAAAKTIGTVGEGIGAILTKTEQEAAKKAAFKTAVKQGAAAGGVYGGVSGFGNAEGGVENRAVGTAFGTGIGAGLGAGTIAAMPWLVNAGRGVSEMVANSIAPWSSNLDTFINQTAGKVLNKAAGEGPAIFRDAPLPEMALTTGQSTNNPGLQYLEKSSEMGSPQGSSLSANARTGNNQAVRTAIGDVGDLNADAPGQMRNALVASQPEQAPQDQVIGMLRDHLGDASFYDTGQALNTARKAKSAPLYDKAMNAGPVIDDRVNQFLADPILKQGIGQGMQIQRLEALADNKPFDPKDYGVTGFDPAGDPIIGGVPNMRLLDAGKKGLDAIVEGYRNPITGKLNLDQYGNAVNSVRAKYVQALDAANPDYAAARAAWAGPSQSLDALNAGRNIFKPDAELTAQRIASLSPGDLDFHNIGVLRAIEDVTNNSPNGAAALNNMLSKPSVQEKLSAAFKSPEGFADFRDRAADILNPQGDIAAATAKDAAGNFKLPQSAVADQFIHSKKGAPEAFNAYLNAVGDNPEGLQAARDAFAQKFLEKVQTNSLDQADGRIVSASGIRDFLDDYGHVVNSRLFDDTQRDLINRIGQAADMSQATVRSGAKGGPDTYAKMAAKSYTDLSDDKTFLDVLIGPKASKFTGALGLAVPAVSTLIGAHLAGGEGAVVGSTLGGLAVNGMGRLLKSMYAAPRAQVADLVQKALADPALAKTLMTQASNKAALQIPSTQRRLIYGVLGADAGNAVNEALKTKDTGK